MIKVFNGTDYLETVTGVTIKAGDEQAFADLQKELDAIYGEDGWTDVEIDGVRTPRL